MAVSVRCMSYSECTNKLRICLECDREAVSVKSFKNESCFCVLAFDLTEIVFVMTQQNKQMLLGMFFSAT